jgi:hypothetical protein
MLHEWEPVFDKFQEQLRQLTTANMAENELAENLYMFSLDYWLIVKRKFLQNTTITENEEIAFFRHVKPRFSATIEYYLLVNQGLIFNPSDPFESIAFWNDEQRRYARFCERNHEFVHYYESGAVNNDASYFLRKNNQQPIPYSEKVYLDENCRSAKDHLIRGLLAGRRYQHYVEKRAGNLKMQR